MADLPKISYSGGGVRVKVDLGSLEQRMHEAQQWLGDRVLEDCRACMPHQTGDLQQRSKTEDGGKRVVFPGPYARYLYHGKVMVDKDTKKGPRKIPTEAGGYVLRFRKGAKLVATDRPLKYSNPQAVPEWFEHAKRQYGQFWIEGVAEKIGGK
nr:MAG TPA: Minor capsid protein [Caudoviricetes sp.]